VSRPLGDTQRHVLWTLSSHDNGIWYPGSNWVWANTSTTIRIMDSLARRGLAIKRMRESRLTGEKYPHYTITDEGRKVAGDPAVLPAKTRKD